MTPGSDSDLIPPSLAAEIRAAADEQHRPASDVVREALERYLKDTRAAPHRREVFRTEELSDAELAAITEGGMDPRHNHLNTELE